MTTKEVAKLEGVDRTTVINWCQKQGDIKRKIGVNGISEYDLTDKEVKLFRSRRPKGRPKSSNK